MVTKNFKGRISAQNKKAGSSCEAGSAFSMRGGD
jgi:hypothetical protein